MIINTSLLMFGAVALTIGMHYLCKDQQQNSWHLYIAILGFFVFVWTAGYACMGMMSDFSFAYILRNVGLLGVLGFVVTECYFFLHISHQLATDRWPIILCICVFSAADFLFFSQRTVLTFTRIGERTCYYANGTFARGFHSVYVLSLFLLMCWFCFIWYRDTQLKREKQLVLSIFVANFCIVLATLPDTFMPLISQPSIPTSGFGAFAALLILSHMDEKHNAFSISVSNLGKYIYPYTSVPILVLSRDHKIVLMNDYGKRFLGSVEKDSTELSDFFEISMENSHKLLDGMTAHSDSTRTKTHPNDAGAKQTCRLKSRKDDKLCELNFTFIRDSYDEVYCILCLVNDMSDETRKMEALQSIKNQLQRQLSEKNHETQWATFQAITTMANAIDAKDSYTKGHSVRVAEYSELLARAIGWNDAQIENLHYIALLHDIGKIGVPDSVLNKPERLSAVEIKLLQSHTTMGGEILKDITLVDDLAVGAMYHHERYDGKGYPYGLKGDAIPIEARIICIADTYDAMNTDRIYRKRLPFNIIREQLLSGKGTQFDPDLVDDFLTLFSTGRLSVAEMPELDERHDTDKTGRLLQSMINKTIEKQKENAKIAVAAQGDIDYLTGIYTKKTGEKYIKKAIQETPGCLAVIDIDNMKRVNSVYGHLAGDLALKILGHILAKYSNQTIAARYGGDEFLLFMKNIQQDTIQKVIDEILYSYKCQKDAHQNLKRTSLSIGLCITHQDDSYEHFYQNASKVLYNVKQTGKNRYDFYKEIPYSKDNRSTIDLRLLLSKLEKTKLLDNETADATEASFEVQDTTHICSSIYNHIRNYSEPIQLIMITIQYKEGAERALERHEYLMQCMHVAIMEHIDNAKKTFRFSGVQYLILLPGNHDKATLTTGRIFKRFYKICSDRNADISYDIAEYQP